MKHLHYETIDSTSEHLKRNRAELDSLTAVSASFQSSGKGRMGRSWLAQKDEAILCSILLKDKEILEVGPFLSLIAATSVAKTIEGLGIEGVAIKWPNDVYIHGKKVCGILLEGNVEEYIVIGIGINVNQVSFPVEGYRVPPTSLHLETQKEMHAPLILDELLKRLEIDLKACKQKEGFLSYYRSHDYLLGKKVDYLGEAYTVIGVDEDFALLLEKGGEIEKVTSNEVTLALI